MANPGKRTVKKNKSSRRDLARRRASTVGAWDATGAHAYGGPRKIRRRGRQGRKGCRLDKEDIKRFLHLVAMPGLF
jgi:hypothetical protein